MNRIVKLSMVIFFLSICSCRQEKAEGPDYYVIPVVDTGVEVHLYEMMGIKKEYLSEKTKRGKEDADYNYDSNQPSYTKLNSEGASLPDSTEKWALIRDNITGRVWEAKTADGSIHDRNTFFTFEEAQDHVDWLNSIKYGGFSNWRIPNLKELSSIIHFEKKFPSSNTDYFKNQYSSFYWSSTECVDDNRFAWGILFQRGVALNHFKKVRYCFRAVCIENEAFEHVKLFGDQTIRFKDNGDGTVTDYSTGLMWQKDCSKNKTGEKKKNKFKWHDARVFSEESDYAGYTDWRLPNIKELISIVDYRKEYPAIYSIFNDTIDNGDFMSSTPNGKSQCPYILPLKNGDFDIAGTPSYIRLVRNFTE
ncbi:DUF1566 domain-containing protein [Desulfoluna spongiiphila]|uniref:Lcl C-terminal domain-containing protein n=1 Tax=Desulfoluna spongiiphila TaxID=419481 RepID=A0A1G5HV26_9BACT|nr:DUF1566 domain-containing protein [Desulfoluna spongiiphila]SCY67646.1 Protein of unknown function [Desulfoluna spongiiphila]